MRTINNPSHRRRLFDRLERLDPEQPALWGSLTPPRMVAHLCDQMRMPLSDEPVAPVASPTRYPVLRELFLYLLPWPKGKVQAPPGAFETDPAEWSEDLARLSGLVDDYVSLEPDRSWPDHPHFGIIRISVA
jgi:hypothetical protein